MSLVQFITKLLNLKESDLQELVSLEKSYESVIAPISCPIATDVACPITTRLRIQFTVFFDALQLSAMLCWLRPRLESRRISRYLVMA